MAYNTGNPIGSTDPRDAADNKENFDRFALSTARNYTDRLGVERKTVTGALQDYAAYNSRGVWTTATAYNVNDIWRDGPSGAFYLVLADYTSGATAAADIAGGNVVVHQPKGGVVSVNTWADLETTFEPAFDGQQIELLGYSVKGIGGGMFYADFSDTTTASDGVTVAVTTNGKRIKRKLENDSITFEMAGAIGDGVTDDSDAIERALYLRFGGYVPTSITETEQLTINLLPKTYRITRQMHQPSGVRLIGQTPVALQGQTHVDILNDRQSRIYCDFPYEIVDSPSAGDQWTKKSAWLISGFSLNAATTGQTVGELCDPYIHNLAGAIYDGGGYTRSFFCEIKDVMFYTDKNIANAVGIAGHPSFVGSWSSHGFLFGSCIQSSWGSDFKLRGENYHCGMMATTINGSTLNSYLNKISTVPANVPAIGATTVPYQWQESSNSGHPAGDFYLTTGNYITFSTSVAASVLTQEKWERGGVYWNSKVTIGSLYMEGVSNLGMNVVSSNVSVLTATINNAGANGTFKTNDSGSVYMPNITNNEAVLLSLGSGSGQPKAKNYVFVSESSFIHPDEAFYGDTIIECDRNANERAIYVSSSGNNTNTGLGKNNPVLTMNVALEHAKFYSINRIIIADGDTVQFTGFSGNTSNVDVTIESDAGATVTCGTSGNNLNNHVLHNCSITFKNISLVVPNTATGTPNTDFRGMFNPSGVTRVVCDGGSVTSLSTYVGLFSEGAAHSGVLNFNLYNGCTLNVNLMSVNGALTGAGVRYTYTRDGSSTASGSQSWSSGFTPL